MRTGWAEPLRTGEVTVVLAISARPIPELPRVPLAIDGARTPDGRRLVEVGVHDQGALARPYVLPPGTPPGRVRLLRQAFQATLDDPASRAEADRARLEVDPVSGEELGPGARAGAPPPVGAAGVTPQNLTPRRRAAKNPLSTSMRLSSRSEYPSPSK